MLRIVRDLFGSSLLAVLLASCNFFIIPDKDKWNSGEKETCGDGIDNNGDGLTDVNCANVDDDGDGHTEQDGDCNDEDPEVNPDATEICDEQDNNCDGAEDEGAAVDAGAWYADNDMDGFGDGTVHVLSCTEPRGMVPDWSDCDDTDAQINPDGTEVCDSKDLDEDCDGLVEDADDSATGQTNWYADADEDGYGDPDDSFSLCRAPSGYVADSTDCDDTEAASNPGGTEACDTLDNNCDGSADEGLSCFR